MELSQVFKAPEVADEKMAAVDGQTGDLLQDSSEILLIWKVLSDRVDHDKIKVTQVQLVQSVRSAFKQLNLRLFLFRQFLGNPGNCFCRNFHARVTLDFF